MYNVLVVGAGFAGSVIAHELAQAGISVHLIDKRDHIGGNAFDYVTSSGERVHNYGPHLFHGNKDSQAVKWLSRFTDWVSYEHRVKAFYEPLNCYVPLPVNRETINAIYNLNLATDSEAELFLDRIRDTSIKRPTNSDQVFLSSVGPELADIFFRPYTLKMWGMPASDIEAAVGARIPVRFNDDDRYFTDTFQAMPKNGYTQMFAHILDHPLIHVDLLTSFSYDMLNRYDHSFLSVPIDSFFDNKYGQLPYRSLKFHLVEEESSQPATTVNFTNSGRFTRVTQWDLIPNSGKSNNGNHLKTFEEPCSPDQNNNELYYPVRNSRSIQAYANYSKMAYSCKNLTFCGRIGLFRYLDMVPAINIHYKMVHDFLSNLG